MIHALRMGEDALAIDFSAGRIVSLRRNGRELLAGGAALPFFALGFRDRDGNEIWRDAYGAHARRVQIGEDGGIVQYAFPDGDPLLVTIRISISAGSGRVAWRASVENKADWALEWIEFPRMALRAKKDDGRSASVFWPYNEGVQIDDLSLRDQTWFAYREPVFPQNSLLGLFPAMVQSQFIAYQGDAGVYLGAHDSGMGPKNIDFSVDGDAVRLKMRVYAGGDFGRDWDMDYDIVLALCDGGWREAADLYRQWLDALEPKPWASPRPAPPRPAWYNDSPVVVTYPVRGLNDADDMRPNRMFPYTNALPALDRLAARLESRLLVLLMHWEGTAPWAPPYVWPPYGGETAFREFMDALHARGHLLGVYQSGMSWTQQSHLVKEYNREDDFARQGIADAACLAPDGSLMDSDVCRTQRRGHDLCPACPQTIQILRNEIRRLREAGLDYAQVLDQNHGGHSMFCYARQHGHPPVPGPWQTRAVRRFLEELREEAGPMLLGCESAPGEPYIPYLPFSDNRFSLGWFFGEPIPMHAWLYHEYASHFCGNQVCANGAFADPDSLLYRLAYSFMAGDMLTLVLTDDGRIASNWGCPVPGPMPCQESVLRLARNLNLLRRGPAAPYLHGGRMLRPWDMEGIPLVEVRLVSRPPLWAPQVLASRWRGADGSEGQVLANHGACAVLCRLADPPARKMRVTSPDGGAALTDDRVAIDPLSAVLIEALP